MDSLSHLPVFTQACPMKLFGCLACHRWWVWANTSQLAQEAHGFTHVRRANLTLTVHVTIFQTERGEQNSGNHAHDHSTCPELKTVASPFNVDVHLCFSLCDFHASGDDGVIFPAPFYKSFTTIMYPPCVRPVPSQSFDERSVCVT